MKTQSIGIVTILKTNNYGAELQASALQNKLNKLGYRAEIIDYLFYKSKGFSRTKKARPFVKIGLKRKLKEYINPLYDKWEKFFHKKESAERDLKFQSFHEKNTCFSKKTFTSIDGLYQAELNYDIFIVGSDQVWNPYSNINLEPYFLTFAPKDKKKISYASSFGVSEIPGAAQPIYKKLLNNLDYISVREEQGVKLVQELTGRETKHVLDPTLLLDCRDWVQVASFPLEKKNYLLLYILTNSDYATQLAKIIAKKLNLTLVRICKDAMRQDSDSSILNITDAGPSEFIGLFMNASFVITNSFHGTAFSVNFEKPFFTVLPKHKPNNSRQKGLLKSVSLENRLIAEGAPFPREENFSVDFEVARLHLANLRKKSMQFLISAIEGVEHG